MTFIRPISDIHNEFSMYNLPVLDTDAKSVLILAGDICVAESSSTLVPFLDEHADRFTDVLYIPGNHEYYRGSLNRVDDKLGELCNRYSNVHYMNQKAMSVHGIKFIGATLWTDFRMADPMVMLTAQESMNDFVHIRTGKPGFPYERPIYPIDIVRVFNEHSKFIESELRSHKESGSEDKVVVFTHHCPTFACRPSEEESGFRHGLLDYAYYNVGLDGMIEEYSPDVWIYGHSHFPTDQMLGDTRLINNSRGYAKHPDRHESKRFNASLVIEL